LIGSGPTAFAALEILKKKEVSLTHFDAGLNETHGTIKKFSKEKSTLGNDFPYIHFPFGPQFNQIRTRIPTSFANGGLSNVWGATLLPYAQEDIKDWPIDLADLAPYYRLLETLIPMSARKDNLANVYPLYAPHECLDISRRISRLINVLEREEYSDLFIGHSRLAIQTRTNTRKGCHYCNNCLRGCQEGFIWNSRTTSNQNTITSRVLKLSKLDYRWSIEYIDFLGKYQVMHNFDKIFVCCGPIESFRILSTSGLVPAKAELRESMTFYIPILLKPEYGVPPQESFGLSQAFIRLEQSGLSSCPSHFQLYEYSSELAQAISQQLKFLSYSSRSLVKFLAKRSFVAIGYLHSDESPSALLSLESDGHVILAEKSNLRKKSIGIARKNTKILSERLRRAGVVFSQHAMKFSKFGAGAHAGSWLPMGLGSNNLGEPFDSKGIHVLDSSVLPSIPAGAMTFTVMANAMRIVDEALS
jgi:hypothetical protein